MKKTNRINSGWWIKRTALLVALLPMAGQIVGQEPNPVWQWSFDRLENRKVEESVSGTLDSVQGKYRMVPGISGQALRLDGFTCLIDRQNDKGLVGSSSLTVEAWVAVGAYPWNWCPVITQLKEEEGGFSFEIGPRGELGMRQMIGGNLISCVSERQIPLNTWTHIAATVETGKGIRIFINGMEAGRYSTGQKPAFSGNAATRIGMNYSDVFPAYRIGTEGGDTPYWFSIDGIIDEIRVFREVLPDALIISHHSANIPVNKPDLPVRRFPRVEPTGRFQAYHTKLAYYDEWDEQWPVDADPDIVVTFRDSPVKLVFWRGTRYSPAWVTDNHLWMADQSVETWNGPEGCLEHMQDRHCKYSHVRIIENTDARIVVHWRYAPVSAYDKLRTADSKTGWEVWIDEYYYIYPDATAIRKVGWKTDYMCDPVQFQESLPLTEEGQLQGDVLEADYLRIANLRGETQEFQYVENPEPVSSKPIPEKPNVQQHNFRSAYDPFIIFEPGNEMHYLSDRNIANLKSPGSCNHWPVGQAYCDGRRVVAADRPTHFLGFPISDPVRHDGPDGRSWINSLYGMKDVSILELVTLGQSWSNAPKLTLTGSANYQNLGFDMSEKAYVVKAADSRFPAALRVKIDASGQSPLYNPAIRVENWGDRRVRLLLNGRKLSEGTDFTYGFIRRLEGTHLIVWIKARSSTPQTIVIESDAK